MRDKITKVIKKLLFAILLATGAVLFSFGFLFPRRFNFYAAFNSEEALKAQNDLNSMIRNAKTANEKNAKIYGRLDSLINCNHPLLALPMVDSMINLCGNVIEKYDLLYYKGEIYLKNNQPDSSLYYYNLGLAMHPTPNLLLGRANLYTKTGRLKDALKDDEDAFAMNPDFAVEVGNVFSLLHQKDSAKFYYKSYLANYPNDTIIVKKLKALDLITH